MHMSKRDTIKVRGFLSVEIESYRKSYRNTYADKFAICEEKSDAATQRLFNADMSVFDSTAKLHVLTSIALWMRCLSTCQAGLLLLERGMVPEALTLVRTAYEFLFYAVAGLNDTEVFESMKQGDSHARKVQAESMALEGKKAGELTKQ
jgi:hypothetical protein